MKGHRIRRTSVPWRGVRIPPGSLDVWRAARSGHASQLVECVFFGDSTTDFGNQTGEVGWVYRMRALALADGYTDGGRGLVHDEDAGSTGEALAPVVSRTGFGLIGGGYDPFGTNSLASSAGGDEIVLRGYGTRSRLHYSKRGTTGGFSYAVDGGPAAVVESAGASGTEIGVEDVDLGSDALHEIEVVNLGGSPVIGASVYGPARDGSGGTIPPGTIYRYCWTSVTAAGESTPGAESVGEVVLGAGNRYHLGYYRVNGATSHKLYRGTGASGGTMDLLATVASDGAGTGVRVGVYTDDGTVTPDSGVHPPATNTAGRGGAVGVTFSIEFIRDAGLVFHNAGVSGISMNTYFGVNNDEKAPVALGLSGNLPSGPYVQRARPPWRDPKLAVVALGINDAHSVDSAPGLYAGVVRFVNMARDAGADPVVVVPHLKRSAFPSNAPPLRDAIIQAAVDEDATLVDFDYALDAGGYGSAGPHLGNAGYDLEAAFMWDNVLSV